MEDFSGQQGPVSIADAKADIAVDLSRRCHPACLVCGDHRPDSVGLRFEVQADGSVVAEFDCDSAFQGYPDRLHGGVVAMLLDAAMTHCLFHQGCAGVTARMEVKFRHPVTVDAVVHIRARLVWSSPPDYQLKAEVLQDGQVKASATGLFVNRPELIALTEQQDP